MTAALRLRGYAYFIECAGKRGGPSPWWLLLVAVLLAATVFAGRLP